MWTDLCGHATLAADHVLFTYLANQKSEICFSTKSGDLLISKKLKGLEMDFPASLPRSVVPPDNLLLGLGIKPKRVHGAFDYIIELENESAVVALSPDLAAWKVVDYMRVKSLYNRAIFRAVVCRL